MELKVEITEVDMFDHEKHIYELLKLRYNNRRCVIHRIYLHTLIQTLPDLFQYGEYYYGVLRGVNGVAMTRLENLGGSYDQCPLEFSETPTLFSQINFGSTYSSVAFSGLHFDFSRQNDD